MSNLNPFMEPGATVSVISGTITNASGANTIGAVSVISGGVSVQSGTVGVSGLFAGFSGAQKFLSGGVAVSGAIPVVPVLYDPLGLQWAPFSTNISGSTVAQVWVASGVVTASIASGAVSVSSGAISLSSGAVSVVSGSVTINSGTLMTPTTAFVWAPLSGVGFGAGATNSGIPSLSGGVSLSSGRVNKMVVRNFSGNADMYVGGSGSRPFSGFGFVLHGGDGLTLDIPNFNLVYLFANTSGQLVSYIGTVLS